MFFSPLNTVVSKTLTVWNPSTVLRQQGGKNKSFEHHLKNLIHRISMETLNVKKALLCAMLSIMVGLEEMPTL